MDGTTKRRVGFGALAGLVIAGVIGGASINVSGQTTPEATDPHYAPYGTLTINITDRAGSVIFDPAGAGPNVIQEIKTVQPCNKVEFVPLPGGDLLTVTAKVGGVVNPVQYTVQIPSNALGVHDGTNCGTPAGLLGPNEQLQIGLGSYFGSTVTAGSASLVVGKSSNQDGDLIVAFDGGTESPRPVPLEGATMLVAPDLANTFETIGLSSSANQKSRGLSINSGTFLNLVVPGDLEVAVGCGETVTEPVAGTASTFVQFYRGAPLAKQGATPCSDVGATVAIIGPGACTVGSDRPGCVYFNNESIGVNGTAQAVSGTLTIDWAPVPQDKLAWLNREIDLDAAGPAVFLPVQWCADDDPDQSTANGKDFNVTTPGLAVPWCVISDVRTLGSDGKIHQTQVYYGQGDPWNR